jgi:hypothetical protein
MTNEGAFMIVVPVVAIVMLYGWIPLAIWLGVRKSSRARELVHLERMRALELGHAPSEGEVARAEAAAARARAAGWIGVLVPLFCALAAVSATVPLVLLLGALSISLLLLLAVVWTASACVATVAIAWSLAVLRSLAQTAAEGGAVAPSPPKERSTAIHAPLTTVHEGPSAAPALQAPFGRVG